MIASPGALSCAAKSLVEIKWVLAIAHSRRQAATAFAAADMCAFAQKRPVNHGIFWTSGARRRPVSNILAAALMGTRRFLPPLQ